MILDGLYVSVEHQTPEAANASLSGFVADLGLTSVLMDIQPLSPSDTDQYGGAYSSSYKGFAQPTASGIINGDQLTVSGTGQQFIVKGKNSYLFGVGQHLEFLLDEVLR